MVIPPSRLFVIIRGKFGKVKLALAAVFAWGQAGMLPEDFAEIAEAAEAHGCCDLGYGPVTASQQKLCLLDAVNAQVILETVAEGRAEQTAEMAGTHVKVAGGIGGSDVFGVMGRNIVYDTAANILFSGKVRGA